MMFKRFWGDVLFLSKEAAVLAKWLKGITLSIAAQRPNDTHAALHVYIWKGIVLLLLFWFCLLLSSSALRLRAAVFVNLVAMRESMNKRANPFCLLSAQNLSILKRANFLYHAAFNRFLDYTLNHWFQVLSDFGLEPFNLGTWDDFSIT